MIDEIRKIAKNIHDVARGSHDFEHIQRVYNLAVHIGEIENADLEILGISALLHDIARHEQDASNGKICHALRGAEIAEEILLNLSYPEDKIEAVKHCILAHRNSTNMTPLTIEAKVLFDADKLDSIGAIGVGRLFMFAGEIGSNFHDKNVDIINSKSYTKEDTAYREFLLKIQHVKNKIITNEGKKIAESRHKYMVDFFNRLNLEVDGEI